MHVPGGHAEWALCRARQLHRLPASVTSAQRHNVLLVPVTALLAGAPGGYQVAVVDGAGRHLIPVRLGLFDEAAGMVEVTGDGLTEGTQVEVPVT